MPGPVTYRVGQVWERAGVRRRILRLFKGQQSVNSVLHGEAYRIDWIRPGAKYPVYGRAVSWGPWAANASLIADVP
jgi:hypothetical protein